MSTNTKGEDTVDITINGMLTIEDEDLEKIEEYNKEASSNIKQK